MKREIYESTSLFDNNVCIFEIKNTRIAMIEFLQKEKAFKETFLRYHEFTSNPTFKGKVFTIDEFEKQSGICYDREVLGVNLTFKHINNLYKGVKLTKQEMRFLKWLEGNGFVKLQDDELIQTEDFFITVFNSLRNTNLMWALEHEMSHALFHSDPTYRKYVKKGWSSLPLGKKKKVISFLKQREYSKEDFLDEFAAYYIEDYNGDFDDILFGFMEENEESPKYAIKLNEFIYVYFFKVFYQRRVYGNHVIGLVRKVLTEM